MPHLELFLSYPFDAQHFEYQVFAHRVCYYLNKQCDIEAYCYYGLHDPPRWRELVGDHVIASDHLVYFAGHKIGNTQVLEADLFREEQDKEHGGCHNRVFCVRLAGDCEVPSSLFDQLTAREMLDAGPFEPWQSDEAVEVIEQQALLCAEAVVAWLHPQRARRPDQADRSVWIPDDGLPLGYPFDYEKDIIQAFVKGRGRVCSQSDPKSLKLVQDGCPLA